MNYMEQVTQMLGVKFEEEFNIEGNNYKYKISEDGICFYSEGKWYRMCNDLNDILAGKYKIIKISKPILDEVESEYLSYVIKPFRNKIESIAKYIDEDGEYISLIYKDLNDKTFSMAFPSYDDDTMYRGMEIGKRYTLEELGL